MLYQKTPSVCVDITLSVVPFVGISDQSQTYYVKKTLTNRVRLCNVLSPEHQRQCSSLFLGASFTWEEKILQLWKGLSFFLGGGGQGRRLPTVAWTHKVLTVGLLLLYELFCHPFPRQVRATFQLIVLLSSRKWRRACRRCRALS